MKRDLTRALMWGRNAAHTKASAAAGGGMTAGGGKGGLRARVALVAALALLSALALTAAPASAFTEVTSFDGSRTPAGTMAPERLAVDEVSGDVYVIDSANGVVDIFNTFGKYLSQLTSATTANCTLGSFGFDNFEDDVAVDNSTAGTQGNVYIVGENQGTGPSIVTAFDRSGNCLWQVNSPFSPPTRLGGVAVDPLTGDVWIGDRRVGMYRLNPATGAPIGDPPGLGCGGCAPSPGNENPAHLAFDSLGNLYGSAVQGATQKWDRGLGDPPFSDPASAMIDPAGAFDVEVDQTTNDVFVDHGTSIEVYDSTGAVVDPGFGTAISFNGLHGVAVDGRDHIYVANQDTNTVDIWTRFLLFHAVTVTVDGTGTGNVDADHGAILGCGSNGGPCTDNYFEGDTVTLTATPDPGMVFGGWSGDIGLCDPNALTCEVPIDAAKNITATFNVGGTQDRVTVDKVGSGTVTVNGTSRGSPSSFVCGPTCSGLFDDRTEVRATAVADSGWTFTGWSGGGCSGAGECDINPLTADTTITATFTRPPPPAPSATTGSASGISQTGATVGGSVNPNGSATSCHFDYGTTTAYGATAPCASSPGSGTSPVNVSASLSGLTAGTTYHFRLVASNGTQTTNGSDATFATLPNTCQTDASLCPPRCDPQHLNLCPPVRIQFAGFSSKTLIVSLRCVGLSFQPACTGKLTFKAVIKVKVKHGKRTKLVKKTITVATASYSVAAGASGSVKLKLTSAAKAALKRGSLTARSTNPKATIHLPKTKVKKKKKKKH